MRIFVLIGRSSTGKDTLYKKLLESDLGLSPIILCTTRPMRPGETDGVEYFFKTDEEFEKDFADTKVVEFRQYNTTNGIWTYYTKDFGGNDKDYLVIGTLKSYSSYLSYYGVDVVIPLYITLDEELLLSRAFEREKATNKDYTEMCRRFVNDSIDFSEKNIADLGIKKRFENIDLQKCFSELYDFIYNAQHDK